MPYKDKDIERVRRREKRLETTRTIQRLKEKPCADCGIQYHFAAMQFDHVKGEKLFNIGTLRGKNMAMAKILAEIEKCEVVCANCHAIRTYNRRTSLGVG